jgi:hypothetical protein
MENRAMESGPPETPTIILDPGPKSRLLSIKRFTDSVNDNLLLIGSSALGLLAQ